jgi:ubiquinone/menaquinone biosynthesis C-methylase UbiE
MQIKEAYNEWASQYDSNINKTRDTEAIALHTMLENISFDNCLEIGCGTGKNTEWLITKAQKITAVDFSEEMLAKAHQKITSTKVEFVQADITQPWKLQNNYYHLVTCSLVLEHIKDLAFVFENASRCLEKDGLMYVGELHPFKQYSGSKARFESENGTAILDCYTHHISEFILAAKKYQLQIQDVQEYFAEGDEIPRILCLLFKKL